jgi:hypothetical protein
MADLLWHSERQLWLEGVDAFQAIVHPDCIMAFAAPIGVMKGKAIIESLEDAPRWADVEMSLQTSSQIGNATILAYFAKARRAGASGYSAYCTSTYIREGDDWRIVQHQQTPVA